MAGAYHMEYWIELGILASYLIPSLALGVVFRRPVIKANDWIIEKLESTKLFSYAVLPNRVTARRCKRP